MSWIQTYTGKAFDLLDPLPSMICIEDIAHALSLLCRYTGHTREHYSVAQHSVYVANLVPEEHALAGLLHDAAEAYCGDVSRPLKRAMKDVGREPDPYTLIEEKIRGAVQAAFHVDFGHSDLLVQDADLRMLATEARDLGFLSRTPRDWGLSAEPYERRISRCLEPATAESLYLRTFHRLTGKSDISDLFT